MSYQPKRRTVHWRKDGKSAWKDCTHFTYSKPKRLRRGNCPPKPPLHLVSQSIWGSFDVAYPFDNQILQVAQSTQHPIFTLSRRLNLSFALESSSPGGIQLAVFGLYSIVTTILLGLQRYQGWIFAVTRLRNTFVRSKTSKTLEQMCLLRERQHCMIMSSNKESRPKYPRNRHFQIRILRCHPNRAVLQALLPTLGPHRPKIKSLRQTQSPTRALRALNTRVRQYLCPSAALVVVSTTTLVLHPQITRVASPPFSRRPGQRNWD